MKLINYEIINENKEITLLFNYPVIKLETRKAQFKNMDERINFLLDILNALNDLQADNMIHGNLTESHIYYDEEQNKYFILDRINHMKEHNY